MKENDLSCYKYKGKIYFGKKPPFTKVSKVIYDEKLNKEVGLLESNRPMILPILSFIFVIFVIYVMLTQEQEQHYVNVTKSITFYDNYLDINIVNDSQNTQSVSISLLYKNISLFEKEELRPGQFIGTIEKKINLSPGSYTCKFKYVIHGKYIDTIRYYDVLLNIK